MAVLKSKPTSPGRRHVVRVAFDGDTMRTSGAVGSLEWTRPPRFVDHASEPSSPSLAAMMPDTWR